MIESLLEEWDGETVIVHFDKATGAWILIAIHSTRLGPAAGGTRMKTYPGLENALQDALRLAAGMTFKFAVPGIERGGGKAVIFIPEDFNPRYRFDLLRRYGKLVNQLGGLFYTGPDIGTSSDDMDIIAETGAPYVFCRTPAAGGSGDSGPITALGVFTGIKVACEHVYGEASLKGRRVLVQGAGSVGKTLIDYLRQSDAVVIFSDVSDDIIRHFRDGLGLEFVPAENVFATRCDIFAPCALGGVLDAGTIEQLNCKIVAGGANNQLADPEDAALLLSREILYAPDYVINAGAAIAIPAIELRGWSREAAEKHVVKSIKGALQQVFDLAAQQGITTETAARIIAEKRLAA